MVRAQSWAVRSILRMSGVARAPPRTRRTRASIGSIELGGVGYGGLLRGSFGRVDGQGEGPKAVVVGAVWVAEGDLAGFGEFVFFCVELVEGLAVERDVEGGLGHPLFEELGHLLFGGLGEVVPVGLGTPASRMSWMM